MTTPKTPLATTYDQLLDRVISDGIAEVRAAYAAPEEHHKRDGAIAGFEACRGKSPAELVTLWTEAERATADLRLGSYAESGGDPKGYWQQRYKALQIEWVCNVVSVALVNSGEQPLMSHLPTARAAMKYAAIVGVRGTDEVRS